VPPLVVIVPLNFSRLGDGTGIASTFQTSCCLRYLGFFTQQTLCFQRVFGSVQLLPPPPAVTAVLFKFQTSAVSLIPTLIMLPVPGTALNGVQRGSSSPTLVPLLLTIHITDRKLNYYFFNQYFMFSTEKYA